MRPITKLLAAHPKLGALALLSTAAGCSGTHALSMPDAAAAPDGGLIERPDAVAAPDAFVTAPAPLEACLLAGGELVEVARVFNNDREDHGALVTFGVSDTGLLAAAGADGTLKFWSLEAEHLGTVSGSVLTYGSEISAPITDMVLSDERVIAGDGRGLVAEILVDGSFLPRGGTTPDVPIAAVGYWPMGDRIAHAQHAEGLAPLTVRDAETVQELSSGLLTIRDLAYTPDGTLWVAGARLDGERLVPAVERRDPTDPSRVLATLDVASPEGGEVIELATSASGEVVAMLTAERVEVRRGEQLRTIPFTGWAEIVGVSVALGRGGEVAFTVESSGMLVAHAANEERTLASVDVGAYPVAVRTDATGSLVVVGRSDAYLIAYACAPSDR